jgi:muramoyltetrapeptide carboxypeptidase
VELGKHLTGNPQGYLSAPDKDRLIDLHAMFRSKHVRAIFYHRGGFGSIRLLDRLDYNLIRKNPKIIVGYSDATALFSALYKKAGLSSCFFGPMPGVDLWDDIDRFTEEQLWRVITGTKPIEELPMDDGEGMLLNNFRSRTSIAAKAIGGNLTVLSSLMSTPFQPNFRNAAVLFEEIDEKPRKVDAYFAQLRLAGAFDRARAILLGQFTNCDRDPDAPTRTLAEIFADYFSDLDVPVVGNLPFGHEKRMWTIPFGCKLELNTDGERMRISIPTSVLL